MSKLGKFIGREKEIAQLQSIGKSQGSSIAIVYGRRRIGKTTLIETAFASRKILSFEGLEGQSKRQQIANFLFQLEYQVKERIPNKSTIKHWREALVQLIPFLKKINSPVILLDELQWTANYRSQMIAELKMVWDQYISRLDNVTLVLCGSIASFMVKKVIRSKALYGRAEQVIHLNAFKLQETAAFLSNHGTEEVVLAQLLVGGIPKYLELLKDAPSIMQGMAEHGFRENGYFSGEFERLFISHFGSSSKYEEVIRVLVDNPYGLSRPEIIALTTQDYGGELTRLLYNLESAGFIMAYKPYDSKGNARTMRYVVADFFMNFHLNFIDPVNVNRNTVVVQSERDFINHIVPSGKFRSWLGRAFELICMRHHREVAFLLGFSGVNYNAGPYFRHSKGGKLAGVQLDLLFDRADKVITVCEAKYQNAPVGLKVGKEIEAKIAKIPKFDNLTVQKVLLTKSEASKQLIASGIFSYIIQPQQLIKCSGCSE